MWGRRVTFLLTQQRFHELVQNRGVVYVYVTPSAAAAVGSARTIFSSHIQYMIYDLKKEKKKDE